MNKYGLKGKRLAAIDFGLKRVGYAVCDELHITVTPKRFFMYDAKDFWEQLIRELKRDHIDAIVVGVPYRSNGKTNEVLENIDDFIKKLELKSNLPVIKFDESLSSVRATETMVEIGMKKKTRRKKGTSDKIAAAIILRDFLNELNE